MPTCPRCGKKCDTDFFKEKGLCSECGFSIRQTASNKAIIDQYNSSMRKKTDASTSSSAQSRLTKVNPNDLKKHDSEKPSQTQQNKNNQGMKQTTFKEQPVPSQPASPPIDSVESEEQHIDPIFQTDSLESTSTDSQESKDAIDPLSDKVNLNDPIFVNASGPLSFDDEEDSDKDNMEQKDATPDRKSKSEDAIKDFDIPPNTKTIFLPFFYLKKFYVNRKNLRKEQLEADIDYDFNHDGFYDDTTPISPYEIDAISKKTILKVVAAVVGVFAFIAFIIYYA